MRDELQRMQTAAKTARLAVQTSGSGNGGSVHQSSDIGEEGERAAHRAAVIETFDERSAQAQAQAQGTSQQQPNQQMNARGSPKGSPNSVPRRQPTAADTAIMNELKRSSGDFTGLIDSMDGVNIPEAILPEAIAPEAIATDQITGGAWFNARLGSGGSAAQQEIREAGEPELVPATVVAAPPAAVVASVAAPSLATPGAAPPKELNMGTMNMADSSSDVSGAESSGGADSGTSANAGGGSSSPSTPKRKNSIREKMKFWKRGSSTKKDKKKKAAEAERRKSMMISGPVGAYKRTCMCVRACLRVKIFVRIRSVANNPYTNNYNCMAQPECDGGVVCIEGVNGDLSGLSPEMAAAAKMMWEAGRNPLP